MSHSTESHYERLASTYDRNWAHSPEYVEWMNTRIESALRISSGDRIADIGAGTGLFLRRLMSKASAETPILCIDPSQRMLDRLPEDPRLRAICASAEDVANGKTGIPYQRLDAILIKETIHHFDDISGTIHGLAGLLAPGGRLFVVSLTPVLAYPLFRAALDRFAVGQPEPSGIAADMRAAGLSVDLTLDEFPVTVDRDHYVELVANRWMSVLSTFTDEELAAGLEEMRARYPERQLSFVDRFAFVLGIQPG